MLYSLMLIGSGLFLGCMISLNGQLGGYYSVFSTAFFVHAIALVALLFFVVVIKKQKISFAGVPKYVYLSGILGVYMVTSNSFVVLKIGATALLGISIMGKMFSSALVDHFGWFGAEKIPFKIRELPCYALVLTGVMIVVLTSGGNL